MMENVKDTKPNLFFPLSLNEIEKLNEYLKDYDHTDKDLPDIAPNLSKFLLFHPDISIQTLALRLFYSQVKIPLIRKRKISKIQRSFPSQDQEKGWFYFCTFLDSKNFSLYQRIRKWIHRNQTQAERILRKLLLFPRESVSLNAIRLLNHYFPIKYPISDIFSVYPNLDFKFRMEILDYIAKSQLYNSNHRWEVRLNIIQILTHLGIPEAGFVLMKYDQDPETECRLAVARGIGNYVSEEISSSLIRLLLDPVQKIKEAVFHSIKSRSSKDHQYQSPNDFIKTANFPNLLRYLTSEEVCRINSKIWVENNLSASIITNNISKMDVSLIKDFVTRGNSLSLPEKQAYILLFKSRMPEILTSMHKLMLSSHSSQKELSILNELISHISSDFKLQTSANFDIIL